jgi:hypothetical protein
MDKLIILLLPSIYKNVGSLVSFCTYYVSERVVDLNWETVTIIVSSSLPNTWQYQLPALIKYIETIRSLTSNNNCIMWMHSLAKIPKVNGGLADWPSKLELCGTSPLFVKQPVKLASFFSSYKGHVFLYDKKATWHNGILFADVHTWPILPPPKCCAKISMETKLWSHHRRVLQQLVKTNICLMLALIDLAGVSSFGRLR